jgi:hypothetical protein
MKHTTEYLDVDAVNLYRKKARGEVVIRLITPTAAYDVPLLSHHAAALATALMETAV